MAATKKRRSTTRRKARVSNPKRRARKTTTTVVRRSRRRNLSLFGRKRRRSNPVARRRSVRRGRRRNPISSGVVGEGLKLGVAGMAIGFSQKWIRPLVANFIGSGPIQNAGVTLGTAYGLGYLASFTRYTASWKRPLELAGWTLAMTQLVTSYVLPALSNITGGAGLSGSGWRNRNSGMRGIGVVSNVPPLITAPPPMPAPAGAAMSNGMSGVGVQPGGYRF